MYTIINFHESVVRDMLFMSNYSELVCVFVEVCFYGGAFWLRFSLLLFYNLNSVNLFSDTSRGKKTSEEFLIF